MTDWRKAGELADAHRVRGLIRSRYLSPQKARARRAVVKFLASQNLTLCGDLWGGGLSADMMVAAGVPVLSIEDGRQLASDFGITTTRAKRALTIAAEEGRYRAAWGSASRNLSECDGAWLDFCGHWSPQMSATIRSCRHMKALAITVMPERTPVGSLSRSEWREVLTTLVEIASGMAIYRVVEYERTSGLPVFALLLRQGRGACFYCGRQRTRSDSSHCGRAPCKSRHDAENERSRRDPDRERKRSRDYMRRPDVMARVKSYEQLADVRERRREKIRASRLDPAYRERERLYRLEYKRRPDVIARDKARTQLPEQRAKSAESQRRYRLRKLARQSESPLSGG